MTEITNKIMLEKIIKSLEDENKKYRIEMSKIGRQLDILYELNKLPDKELNELIKGIKKFSGL